MNAHDHDQEDVAMVWLAGQHRALNEELPQILNLEAGLSEIMIAALHRDMAADLATAIDLGAGLAAVQTAAQVAMQASPPERVLRTPPSHLRILLLAADPVSANPLAVDVEARAIAEKIRLSRVRDAFQLITRWAVRPDDLLQYLHQQRPQIVHFSGQGSPSGKIFLSAGNDSAGPASVASLGELFRTMCDDVRVVVLNACYTAAQARAINQHIDFVIGTRTPITDEAAIAFTTAFYSALGFGRTVPQAFDQAKASLMVRGLFEHDIPELLVRAGADLKPLWRDQRVDATAEAAAMSDIPSTIDPSATLPPHPFAASSAANVIGNNIMRTGTHASINLTAMSPRKGIGVDTKMLFAALIADVVFFFYGMWSYTGRNPSAETWRAVIMLVMFGVTGGMVRRWLRRRT